MDIWHIEEPYLPTSSWATHHLGRWAQLPPHGSHSEEIGVVWVLHCIILYCICFYLIMLYWNLSSLHTCDFHMSLSLTATITGGEIPGNSRVARCAEAVKWSSGWDHLSDFKLNVDFEFGFISSPKSRNRWTLNTPGQFLSEAVSQSEKPRLPIASKICQVLRHYLFNYLSSKSSQP